MDDKAQEQLVMMAVEMAAKADASWRKWMAGFGEGHLSAALAAAQMAQSSLSMSRKLSAQD